jgi:hypothetical protein
VTVPCTSTMYIRNDPEQGAMALSSIKDSKAKTELAGEIAYMWFRRSEAKALAWVDGLAPSH